MLGKILGLNINGESGTILGEDENRYFFSREDIRVHQTLKKNMCIEFIPLENHRGTDIVSSESCFFDKDNLKFGISTIFITLIFGCIGTFISRYLFAKEPMKKVWMPTLLHFCISIILFVPIFGVVFYTIAVIFFTVKNYKIVMKQ